MCLLAIATFLRHVINQIRPIRFNHHNIKPTPTLSHSAKRPDQVHNRRPTLGHHDTTIQSKTSTRYRQGYHYQPIASTSSQHSPTFVLETRQYPHEPGDDDHDAIVDCPVSAADMTDDGGDGDADVPAAPIPGPSRSTRRPHSGGSGANPPTHQQQQRKALASTSSADIA